MKVAANIATLSETAKFLTNVLIPYRTLSATPQNLSVTEIGIKKEDAPWHPLEMVLLIVYSVSSKN
jgi:hypothetical protein